MSVARYSRDIDLDDLNNVHTLAVLSVPPGSRVLDLGAATGSVSRALVDRRCQVVAVEGDAEGVAALRAHGIPTLHADLETLPREALAAAAFDVVLLLDVLEHLAAPATLLAKVPTWLAPGGRVLISVPNVAHAAVRLSLLLGRFPRSDVGLLDRTHLQFFDRVQLDALVADAGLSVLGLLTVERDLHEADLPLDLAAVPADLVAGATADPSARVYQFFLIAAPAPLPGSEAGLTQALQAQLRTTERAYRQLETYASRVDAELLLVREARDQQLSASARLQDEHGRLTAQLETVTEAYHALQHHARHLATDLAVAEESLRALQTRVSADTVNAQQLADALADRDTLRQQLRERMAELHASGDAQAVLQRDLEVHRAFGEALAAQVPCIAALGGEVAVLEELERFRAAVGTPERATAVAAEAAEFRRLQTALAIRGLARLDAWSRCVPRLREALRALARTLVRTSTS